MSEDVRPSSALLSAGGSGSTERVSPGQSVSERMNASQSGPVTLIQIMRPDQTDSAKDLREAFVARGVDPEKDTIKGATLVEIAEKLGLACTEADLRKGMPRASNWESLSFAACLAMVSAVSASGAADNAKDADDAAAPNEREVVQLSLWQFIRLRLGISTEEALFLEVQRGKKNRASRNRRPVLSLLRGGSGSHSGSSYTAPPALSASASGSVQRLQGKLASSSVPEGSLGSASSVSGGSSSHHMVPQLHGTQGPTEGAAFVSGSVDFQLHPDALKLGPRARVLLSTAAVFVLIAIGILALMSALWVASAADREKRLLRGAQQLVSLFANAWEPRLVAEHSTELEDQAATMARWSEALWRERRAELPRRLEAEATRAAAWLDLAARRAVELTAGDAFDFLAGLAVLDALPSTALSPVMVLSQVRGFVESVRNAAVGVPSREVPEEGDCAHRAPRGWPTYRAVVLPTLQATLRAAATPAAGEAALLTRATVVPPSAGASRSARKQLFTAADGTLEGVAPPLFTLPTGLCVRAAEAAAAASRALGRPKYVELAASGAFLALLDLSRGNASVIQAAPGGERSEPLLELLSTAAAQAFLALDAKLQNVTTHPGIAVVGVLPRADIAIFVHIAADEVWRRMLCGVTLAADARNEAVLVSLRSAVEGERTALRVKRAAELEAAAASSASNDTEDTGRPATHPYVPSEILVVAPALPYATGGGATGGNAPARSGPAWHSPRRRHPLSIVTAPVLPLETCRLQPARCAELPTWAGDVWERSDCLFGANATAGTTAGVGCNASAPRAPPLVDGAEGEVATSERWATLRSYSGDAVTVAASYIPACRCVVLVSVLVDEEVTDYRATLVTAFDFFNSEMRAERIRVVVAARREAVAMAPSLFGLSPSWAAEMAAQHPAPSIIEVTEPHISELFCRRANSTNGTSPLVCARRIHEARETFLTAFQTRGGGSRVAPDHRPAAVISGFAYVGEGVDIVIALERDLQSVRAGSLATVVDLINTVNKRLAGTTRKMRLRAYQQELAPPMRSFDPRDTCPDSASCVVADSLFPAALRTTVTTAPAVSTIASGRALGSDVVFRSDCVDCAAFASAPRGARRPVLLTHEHAVGAAELPRVPPKGVDWLPAWRPPPGPVPQTAMDALDLHPRDLIDFEADETPGNKILGVASALQGFSTALVGSVSWSDVVSPIIDEIVKAIGIGVAIIAVAFLGMLVQINRVMGKLESVTQRHERELRVEKEKFEDICQTALPGFVANRLGKSKIYSEKFIDCTVAIIDISAFSEMSQRWTPRDVIRYIAYYAYVTHETMIRQGASRIRRFGDTLTYLAGGEGGDANNKTLAALGIARGLSHLMQLCGPSYKHRPHLVPAFEDAFVVEQPMFAMPVIRVGVHTGPLFGGVVLSGGAPRFDVHGVTMTIARRMQATAPRNRIHVTVTFKDLLDQVDMNDTFEYDPPRKTVTDGLSTIQSFLIFSTHAPLPDELLHFLWIEPSDPNLVVEGVTADTGSQSASHNTSRTTSSQRQAMSEMNPTTRRSTATTATANSGTEPSGGSGHGPGLLRPPSAGGRDQSSPRGKSSGSSSEEASAASPKSNGKW